MNEKMIFLSGLTRYISNRCGVTTQTVRDILRGKTKGKHYEQILDAYNLFMEENKIRTTNEKNMERIYLPAGTGMSKELGRIFKRSQPFIRKALRWKTNHPDALKIRELARKKISELK